jgi:hypothetical protein
MFSHYLFREQRHQEHLDEHGYVAIPFLSPQELQELRDYYYSVHPGGKLPYWREGIHMTIWAADRAYKEAVMANIRRLLAPAADRVFSGHRIVNPVFIVKETGTGTTFPVHQDWTVTDERRFLSFNVWIPLQDVDEHSGAIWVLPGSHRIAPDVRGPGHLFPDFTPVLELIRPRMKSINIPAGHAAIFYHKVIHGSPPNLAPSHRITAAISVLPKDAPMQIYFQPGPEAPLEIHQPEDDFTLDYTNLRDESLTVPPRGKPVALAPPYRHPTFTPESFERLYASAVRLGLLERTPLKA